VKISQNALLWVWNAEQQYLYFNLWLRVMMDILTRHRVDIYVFISAMSFNANILTAIQCHQTLKRWVYGCLLKVRHNIWRVWRYQSGNQNPSIEEGHTLQYSISQVKYFMWTFFHIMAIIQISVILVINLRHSLIVSIHYWSNLTLLTAELKPSL
jgi:hypothetical protein